MRPDPLVLLVDPDKDFRGGLSEQLKDQSYEVALAKSAPEALEMASRRIPAVVILELELPGIDGIQLVRYFRSRHVFRQMPVILLSNSVGKDSVQAALGLGVQDVMLKSRFAIQELVERIERRLSGPAKVVRNPELARSTRDSQMVPIETVRAPPSSVGPTGEAIPGRSEGDASRTSGSKNTASPPTLAQEIGRMRALPSIVGELLRLASLPDSSLADLEALVRGDPVVAARILQSANSAAYLRGTAVTQLGEAVRALGFTNVSKIVSTSALMGGQEMVGQVGRDMWSLWRHSLAAGSIAEAMAPAAERSSAFLGGLLHDLPSLFALQHLGENWLPVRAHAEIAGLSLHQALSTAMGRPLEALCEQILSTYRIPREVALPVQEYHEFFLANQPQQPGLVARRLDLAHQCAIAAGRPGTEFSQVACVHPDELRLVVASGILPIPNSTELSIQEQLSGLDPWEQELPPPGVSIALWRDPRWVRPDPVESVLAQLADCQRVDRLQDIALPDRVRLAIAEPGTAEWNLLGSHAPLLVLHRGKPPEAPPPPGVETLRMPVPLSLLLQRLRKMGDSQNR